MEVKLEQFKSKKDERLDKIVSEFLAISRNQIQPLIKDGNVVVNKKRVDKPSFKVFAGDEIEISFPPKKELDIKKALSKFDFDVEVVYEDEDLLVINKPSGLTVHPAPSVKEPTLVDWLKDKNYLLSTINGELRAGIVHRLDKGTSGALLIAKNNKTHEILAKQLLDRTMGRYYIAAINLALKENLIVERPIGRNPKNRLKNSVLQGAREAKTAFCSLYDDEGLHLIAAKLFSGRTHQIRVHLESISRAIVGDNLYGFKSGSDKITRIMLHAYILYFIHPKSGKKIEVVADLKQDFKEYINSKNRSEIYGQINPSIVINSFNNLSSWLHLK